MNSSTKIRQVSGATTVTGKQDEILTGPNKPDSILAIGKVTDGRQKLVYARQPFQREPAFAVASIDCNLLEILSHVEAPA